MSIRSAEGLDNLAPHSYFNGVADDPPMVMFSIEGKTDTWRNLQEVPEFVVSFVSSALAEAMEISAVRMPPDEDEFAWAGLGKRAAERVRPAGWRGRRPRSSARWTASPRWGGETTWCSGAWCAIT